MLHVQYPDDSDGECSQPHMAASLAGSGDGDIEGGYSGWDPALDQGETRGISSKFKAVECESEGRSVFFMRRNSQVEKLKHRPKSRPIVKSESLFSQPANETKNHQRQSVMLYPGTSAQESRETMETALPVTIYVDNRSTKNRSFIYIALPVLCLLVIISLVSYQYIEIQSLQNERQVLRDDLQMRQIQQHVLDQSHSSLQRDIQTKQEVIDHFQHSHSQMTAAQSEMSSNMKKLKEDHSMAHDELDRLRGVEKRATWSVKRLDTLVDGIQERSKQRVLEKYGPGPHQVELTVQLPHSLTKKVTIELAPLSIMPHSISTFLDQVTSKSWDGTHFDLHIGHALMGRAQIKKRDGDQPKFQHEPPRISFSEYSDHFPHDEYTIAFHPPSKEQEFYINLRNNQSHHSPRLEQNDEGKDTYVEGGSAFGIVVDDGSRQVVDEMDALAADEGGHLDESVEIVTAEVIAR